MTCRQAPHARVRAGCFTPARAVPDDHRRAILHLRFSRPTFETYRELFTVLGDITPVVQALPPDGALLDLTGAVRYFGQGPADLADRLQTRLAARYGLLSTGGIGPSRMMATLAADSAAPGTVRVLPDDPSRLQHFLWGRPVRALPGVGPALERSLVRYGIATVGDLAALPLVTVQRIAGASTGRLLHERARGTDRRTVTPAGPPATITSARRFERDVLDPAEVRRALLGAATDLGARLRAAAQVARTVELQVTLRRPLGHHPLTHPARAHRPHPRPPADALRDCSPHSGCSGHAYALSAPEWVSWPPRPARPSS